MLLVRVASSVRRSFVSLSAPSQHLSALCAVLEFRIKGEYTDERDGRGECEGER
jgi:hypothetical protein